MVGSHVIELLTQMNIRCFATSRSRPDVLPSQTTWTPWDLGQTKTLEDLDEIFPNVQAIFHVAAFVPPDMANRNYWQQIFDINVRSCINLASWATERNIPFLFLSSATVYAGYEQPNIRESDAKATGGLGGFYGYSKLLSEKTLEFFATEGLKYCVLRPSSIYGYGLPRGKMITKFFELAGDNKTIKLKPPVHDKVNLINASDVAIAMLQALEKEAWGVYNIAGDIAYSILEIAETCVKVVGKGTIEILDEITAIRPVTRFDLNCDLAKISFSFGPKLNLYNGLNKFWNDMNTFAKNG